MTPRSLTTLVVFLWAGAACAGRAEQAWLQWNELGARITGKKVALVLPDGTAVQDKVRGVGPAGLQLKISRTSNSNVQPEGVHTIPRPSVSVLRVTEYRKIGRLLFTAGALAAAGALVAHGTRDSGLNEGPLAVIVPAAGAAGAAGIGVGAYYFGKAVDKRVTEIRVAPGD